MKNMTLKKAEKLHRQLEKDWYKKCDKKFYKKHGFHKEDCWSLDQWFYCNMILRLTYLRDNHMGVPSSYTTDKDGKEIRTVEEGDKLYIKDLNYIINYFYIAYKDEYWLDFDAEKRQAIMDKIRIAREKFAELLPTLWD